MSYSCIKAFVSGRVQGVFYRASAQQQARALGLTGYAKNLSDGRVEVWLEGPPQAIEKMQQWLRMGPPAATVEQVVCEPCEFRHLNTFEVY